MTEILVFSTLDQGGLVRASLAGACRATGIGARLELFGSGSLFQRLRARRSPPPADLILWSGPYAAHAAALENLVQPYQPAVLPDRAAHDPGWRWVAVDFQALTVAGSPQLNRFDDLTASPRLALTDPERSEVGMMSVLSVLDRFRQSSDDVELGWRWWQQRVTTGVVLTPDDAHALSALDEGQVSHALTLQARGVALTGLAPVPHAMSVAAGAREADAARRVLDWLTSAEAPQTGRLSAWQAASNGLQALLEAAPPLDVDWAVRQYRAVRGRWAQSSFGPTLGSP